MIASSSATRVTAPQCSAPGYEPPPRDSTPLKRSRKRARGRLIATISAVDAPPIVPAEAAVRRPVGRRTAADVAGLSLALAARP
jgi:hypothetical protein